MVVWGARCGSAARDTDNRSIDINNPRYRHAASFDVIRTRSFKRSPTSEDLSGKELKGYQRKIDSVLRCARAGGSWLKQGLRIARSAHAFCQVQLTNVNGAEMFSERDGELEVILTAGKLEDTLIDIIRGSCRFASQVEVSNRRCPILEQGQSSMWCAGPIRPELYSCANALS